ncbi:hypothetical protein J3R82DRAFT_4128 [Butyriboletus roseoflavus]|nr:hypothetical protein J3R82DRAFT_4128 [Butyriboletus roseoflavus]
MDSGGRDSPASGQNQKESSISLAASSMINASDVITQEVYQANLKRIQEVKEMVRKLEMNNETAHKNFLIDQLEKRAKDGREAEDMLTRLRNQPGFSETVQFTNNVPSDRPEVILPITATLVEVPESHSYRSHSSSAPTATSHPPQTVRQARLAKHQWSPSPQAHQGQSFTPDAFRYYVPSPTVHHPFQHSAAPHSEAPVDPGHAQNVLPQSRHNTVAHQTGFQPIQMQVQQHSQSWGTSPHQVIALPPADTHGYHTSPAGWIRTAPVHGGPSTGSNSTHREPGFPTQFTASRPPTTTHNKPQNPSLASTSQVQVPLQGIPAGPAKTPPGQPPTTRSHPTRPDHQSQSVSTAVSEPVTIALQRPHKPPQLQQHQQQTRPPRSYPQRLPQPPLQPQQHSQQPQPQIQPLSQSPQHSPQTQARVLSQRALQPPETHSQVPPQSADRIPSTSVSQPHNQSSQPSIVQEQARQRGELPRADQATFIRVFQMAVQGGILRLKAFWFHAKASGISDEWFSAAINSLPPDVWQSVLAQVDQSGPTLDTSLPENARQQHLSTIPGSNSPAISAPPPPTATPLVQTAPAIQQATKPRITHSASGQAFGPYTAQLQYYAEQATKSALSITQVASIPTIPLANIAPTQTTVATAKRDVPQAQANVRTPRDASKSRLARDILRSLGKIVPNPDQETGGKPTEKANHEGDRLPEVTPSRPVSRVASPQPPVVPAATSVVDTNSRLIPSEKPNVQDEQQRVVSPSPSTAKSVLKEASRGQAAVIEGPIMIDLTLEDSDESVDANEQDPTFPIQPSATAATSSQPASPTNTTNHTPLLENLTLEESAVNTAADGGNADVRMYSPPLSLAAEESMHSELLYPPPGSTEPASFEQLPREASEHPVDGQLPLFLPSPPVSPAHTEPPETDFEVIDDEGETRPSLKRRSVDVDVMGVDTGLVTPPHVRKRRKRQVYVLIPPAPLYVKKAIKKMKERTIREGIDSDLEGEGENEELQYNHLEQLLIEESRSRLLERRCRWSSCGAILNCAANLLAHVKKHAREQGSQAPFLCHWASCQRQFGMEQERDVHLEKHTSRPLPCPFSGCDEQFDKPVEVMLHEVQHQKADRREPIIHKPTCQPIVPAIPARLGPPPQRLPSHRVVPRRVVKCRISADRHATVGPWVFWNIFSPVDLNMRKQNASMRSRPTRQPISYELDNADPRRDDYDFLLALSSYPAKNPQLDDLDSTLVTMSAARGLTLWGSGSSADSVAGSATSEESMSAVSVTLAVDAAVPSSVTEETKEGKSDGSEVAAAVDARKSGESMAMSEDGPMIRGD